MDVLPATQHAWVPGARPTARSSLPFLTLMSLGVLSIALPPYHATALHLALIAVLAVGLLAVHRHAIARDTRTWLDLVAPLGTFSLVVVLRDAAGGSESGLAPLVLVPLLWLAIFGTRKDLWVAVVLVAVTFLAPVVVLGGEKYPLDDWRKAVIWTAAAALLALAVQDVVRRFAAESRRSRDVAARLEGVFRGATLTSLITTDVDGNITSFGGGAESQLGYAADDVLGRDLTAILFDQEDLVKVAHELGVEPGFAALSRLAHQQAPSRIWPMVRADGDRVFVRMAVTELRDDEDQLVGYLCVSMDATVATVSEQALTQAEERWRVLMEHLRDTTVILVEEQVGVTVVTGAGLLVRKLRDGAGRRLAEIVDQAGPGTLSRTLAAAFGGMESSAVNVSVDGVEHEFTISPLPSTDNRCQALVMGRDVSQDRQRERVLTAAKERAERMFEDAPQGIALLDLAGNITRANPALQALLGNNSLVGRPLSSWSFDPEDDSVAAHLDRVQVAERSRSEIQWTLRGPFDEQLHVVLISTLLAAEDSGVDRILTNVVDVSERHRYERQLAFLAEHDPLTGLANRRRFDQLLARHVGDCRRYGPRGALLMLDLDNFKLVNDSRGHAAGDELLVNLAGVLRQRLRSTDLVARLGGDEFAILLPHADRKAAELVAEDVVTRVAEDVGMQLDAGEAVTVSVGGVVIERLHGTPSDLLSAADSAMYVAKHSGRNRYTFLHVSEPDG